MDLERYEELARNWVPVDEEERRDQQRYIRASMELREIYRRERVSDEVYARMHEEVKATNDEVQVEQFLNNYISDTEYDSEVERIEGIMDEIDAKYNIGQERLSSELEEEARLRREDLRALQVYYEANESYVMRNVDVDGLSNSEAVEMYNSIAAGIDSERLADMISQGKEAIRQASLQPIRDRLDRKGINSNPDNADGSVNGEERAEIEEQIENFKDASENIKNHLNRVKASLVLDDDKELDVTEAIKGLDGELRELSHEADKLIADMDEFRLSVEDANFSMTPVEIKNTVKGFKDRLKELKQHQIDKYNARVDATNKMIEELRGLNDLSEEVSALVAELSELSRCDVTINDWRTIKYLDNIDYNKLVEVNKKIAEINSKRNVKEDKPEEVDLDQDMLWIETRIRRLGTEIKENMSQEDIDRLRQDLLLISDRTNEFNVKLENNKDKISKGEYDEYFVRLNDAQADLADLNIRLNGIFKDNDVDNDFEELKLQLNTLESEVTSLTNLIEALYGNVLEGAISIFEGKLNVFDGRLESIKKNIEESHTNGRLDENQYNQLLKNVAELESKLKLAHEKTKDPGMIKDADIFAMLNGQIDGLEATLDKLEEQVDKLEKPIKDKETRKQIDAIIKRLEEEIKLIEKHLEVHKDEEPEKYKETKERLDQVKVRLDKVGKNYRKKCPLLVRGVKEAKNFFKKHKKVALIAAGLAAIALIHATVGPVLIPAIMHGNIMIGSTTPALRGFVKFVNSILGSVIGAHRTTEGLWILASGAAINPAVGTSSLLKGLAISGVGTTALVAPIIIAIKKLIEKMKVVDLKQKLSEGMEKGKEKVNNIKKKPKSNENLGKKKSAKKAQKEILELVSKFHKSGMSLDEFCEEEGLSEEDKQFLEAYSVYFDKNVAKPVSKKRGR